MSEACLIYGSLFNYEYTQKAESKMGERGLRLDLKRATLSLESRSISSPLFLLRVQHTLLVATNLLFGLILFPIQ